MSLDTANQNHASITRFFVTTFTGNAPRKGKRIPLKTNKYNEQRDEETGYGYLPHQARQAHHGVAVYGSRADDHVAERRPDGRQVPGHQPVRLLHLESREVG